MKIHEILIENTIAEGPLLNKIGTAVGKGVGSLAKGVGSVAGGVAGLGAAAKKGFAAGKATVATGGDDPATADTTKPTPTPNDPAAAAEPQPNVAKAVGQGIKQGLDRALGAKDPITGKPVAATTAQPAADLSGRVDPTMEPTAKPAAAPKTTAAAPTPANKAAPVNSAPAGTASIDQLKASIDKLKPADKQKLLQLIQKPAGFNNQTAGGKQTISTGAKFDPATMKNTAGTPIKSGTVPATKQTSPAPTAAPARDYEKELADLIATRKAEKASKQGAGAFGQMATQLSKPAAEPAPKTTGQAAAAASAAGQDPELAAKKAMAKNNPKMAAMMQQAGEMPAPTGRKQGGGRVAGKLSQTPAAVKKRAARSNPTTTESIDYLVLGK